MLEDGHLIEFWMDRESTRTTVGDIYKGKVEKVLPGLQAAFVDIGAAKSGFLSLSDTAYDPADFEDEDGSRPARPHRIEQMLKGGQELLVQVTKEGINTLGPTLTTYISLPGRYIVLMPWMDRVGVSQKIEEEAERIDVEAVHLLDETDLRVGKAVVRRGGGGDDAAGFQFEAADQLARDERIGGAALAVAGDVDQGAGLVAVEVEDALYGRGSPARQAVPLVARHACRRRLDLEVLLHVETEHVDRAARGAQAALLVGGAGHGLDRSIAARAWRARSGIRLSLSGSARNRDWRRRVATVTNVFAMPHREDGSARDRRRC